MIELVGVRKALRGHTVLDGVDLTVAGGHVHGLVGLNGAGKTTLMRLMLGMQRPDAGTVSLFGTRVPALRPHDWRRVGHFVETPFAYPELTARENLWASGRLHGLDGAELAVSVERIAERLRLTDWLDRRTATLSLGTRQKVGLGAAMLHDPDVLVLDEPTNALDPLAVVALRQLLRAAADRGAAVLLSSHHFDEVTRIADVVTVLHRGRTLDQFGPHEPDLERRFFDLTLAHDLESGVA